MGDQYWWLVDVVVPAVGSLAAFLAIIYYSGKLFPVVLRVESQITRPLRLVQTKWRKYRAQVIVGAVLSSQRHLSVAVDSYESLLKKPPTTAGRDLIFLPVVNHSKFLDGLGDADWNFDIDDPQWLKDVGYPTWLNDYFLVSALEALAKKDKLVKGVLHDPISWPPSPAIYVFRLPRPDAPIEEQAEEIETNSICGIYQSWLRMCRLDSRFDDPWHTRVLESAPPCERCWEQKESIRRWMGSQ